MATAARIFQFVIGVVASLCALFLLAQAARLVYAPYQLGTARGIEAELGLGFTVILLGLLSGGVLHVLISYRLLTNRHFILRNELLLLGQLFMTFVPLLVPLMLIADVTSILSQCLRDPILNVIQTTFFLGLFFLFFIMANTTFLTLLPRTAARTPWTLATLVGGSATDLAILALPQEHFYLAGGTPVPYYIVLLMGSLTLAYLLMNGIYATLLPIQWQSSKWTIRVWNGERLLFNERAHWLVAMLGLVATTLTFLALNHFVWPLVRAWSFFAEACK